MTAQYLCQTQNEKQNSARKMATIMLFVFLGFRRRRFHQLDEKNHILIIFHQVQEWFLYIQCISLWCSKMSQKRAVYFSITNFCFFNLLKNYMNEVSFLYELGCCRRLWAWNGNLPTRLLRNVKSSSSGFRADRVPFQGRYFYCPTPVNVLLKCNVKKNKKK